MPPVTVPEEKVTDSRFVKNVCLLQSHYNENQPKDAIARADQTTFYTEVVALDDQSVLVIYDRVPNGWKAIPQQSQDTNRIWVVKLAWKAG